MRTTVQDNAGDCFRKKNPNKEQVLWFVQKLFYRSAYYRYMKSKTDLARLCKKLVQISLTPTIERAVVKNYRNGKCSKGLWERFAASEHLNKTGQKLRYVIPELFYDRNQ